MDVHNRTAVFWVESAEALPDWTRAAPFRTLFHWLAEHHDAQLVHAAAVGLGGRGVLITGRGGVGKSTCALSCLGAGFDYVGDDYVLLSRHDGLRAYSLYRTAKIKQADLGFFPGFELLPARADPGGEDEKRVLLVTDRIVDSVEIIAVLTPAFGADKETVFEPIDHHYLMGAACYSTIAQLPHAGPQTSDFLERAFHSTVCQQISLGTDRTMVPKAIGEFLRDAGANDPRMLPVEAAPLVSVIIPVFNGTQFLAAAVSNIAAQDYPAVEIIIVDDGSDQDITGLVADLPVQVRLVHQHNQGPAAARNLGIRAASADFLAFLDVDDLWPERKLSTAMRWLAENPDADVVTGRAQLFQDQPGGTPVGLGSPAEGFKDYIGAALYRRRAFDRVGLFDPMMRFAEDSDWFARASHFGARVDRLDLVTLAVRRHRDNMTFNRNTLELSPLRLLKNALDRKRGLTGPV
jgi:GT2 family glycosyltransferase